ncbi:sensor histidine kinase [Sphingomonas sp. 35-24ZXX]|uniref:sensor histidine kinase n=1 Tax=Sphingomonas sp. 35-24ZXX TaxID=1545915 RepID=UPI00053BDF6D|nr:HAMP domain-containing sensor histidine kinase [Sphingomonas sp. 35-24ZXX]
MAQGSALLGWWQRRPIAWQIFMLVLAAVLMTAAAMVALTFGGPPSRPAPTRVDEIVTALRTGRAAPGIGRPIHVWLQKELPPIPPDQMRSPRLEQAVIADLGRAASVRGYSSEGPGPPMQPGAMVDVRGTVTVIRRVGERWQVVQSRDSGTVQQWLLTTFLAILAVLALIMFLAWRVVRSITQPLRAMAAAADATRVGRPWSLAPATTAPEIASVEAALASFDARHRDHLRQQTAMLAAVAHDLGTPLTRLAFRVEALADSQRNAAGDDIALMRALIGNSLALARSTMARSVPVDLSALVEEVVSASWQQASPVSAHCDRRAMVQGEPVALQCLVQNLVDNMQRYAGGGIVTLDCRDDRLVLRAEDEGPGFPVALLGTIGSPFVRGDPSRNAQTGGSGLGLAIARTIAERHGGGLTLGNRGVDTMVGRNTAGAARAGRGAWVEVSFPAGLPGQA